MPFGPTSPTNFRLRASCRGSSLADVARQMGVNNLGENKVYHVAPGKPWH